MKRWFPQVPPEVVAGLLGALAAGAGGGCAPDNSVKAGAPLMSEVVLIERGTVYTLTPDTPACPTGGGDGSVMDMGACNPATDTVCKMPGGDDWCRCSGTSVCVFAPPAASGTWSCGPFDAATPMIAIFDRLLDGMPFDGADGGTMTPEVATATGMSTAGATSTNPINGDYTSNGSTTGLIIPVFERCVFGVYTGDGPSLVLSPSPALPDDATVTIALDGATVHAKDGHTPATGNGNFQGGAFKLRTKPFGVDLAVPTAPPDPDAGAGPVPVPPDMTPVTATFSSLVDPATIVDKVTVTSNGTALTSADVTVASDGMNVTITPVTTWPASATIVVTIAADAADLAGSMLGTAATATFTTAAM